MFLFWLCAYRANVYLKPRGESITDLYTDLRNGGLVLSPLSRCFGHRASRDTRMFRMVVLLPCRVLFCGGLQA